MKVLIFTALLTFVVSIGLSMLFTGTFKKDAPEDSASLEPEETAAQDTQGAGGEPQTQMVQEPGQSAEQQTEQQADQQDSAESEEKLQATLARYKAQIASAEAELAAIKAEIESLNGVKESINRSQQLAKVYSSMKPESVAAILCQLDEAFVEQILSEMNVKTAGKIMDAIANSDPDYCVKLSKIMGKNDKS